MINIQISAIFFLTLYSIVYSTPSGYYRQQQEYQKSQASYVNGELQHKSKDAEFYAKQGEIASVTQKPPMQHHFQHHEEYNKDEHKSNREFLDTSNSRQKVDHSQLLGISSGVHGQSAIEGHHATADHSRISAYQNKQQYDDHLVGLEQKTVEDHSDFTSATSRLNANEEFLRNAVKLHNYRNDFENPVENTRHSIPKFGSEDSKNVKDLTSQCYEAWKMYSMEEMNKNLEEFRVKNDPASKSLRYERDHDGRYYGQSRFDSSGDYERFYRKVDDTDEVARLSLETKAQKPGFWKKLTSII